MKRLLIASALSGLIQVAAQGRRRLHLGQEGTQDAPTTTDRFVDVLRRTA
jgi:hypothetical protein